MASHFLRAHVEEVLVGHVHIDLLHEVDVRQVGHHLQQAQLEHIVGWIGVAAEEIGVSREQHVCQGHEIDIVVQSAEYIVGLDEYVIQARICAEF